MSARTRLSCLTALVASASVAQAQRPAWTDRLAVSVQAATLAPSGRSDLYVLLDRALDGARLRPTLVDGALHARIAADVGVVLGIETGRSTVASTSRVRAAASTSDARQQTSLEFSTMARAGVDWQAWRWRVASRDRLRVSLGGGGGVARYRVHQWGDFVDASRSVVFSDDFRSVGRGAFGYVNATIDVPVRSWLAVQGDARRQFGSARMSGDFASFNRLDLGGTRFGAGLALRRGPR
jgi:hypothetical protein